MFKALLLFFSGILCLLTIIIFISVLIYFDQLDSRLTNSVAILLAFIILLIGTVRYHIHTIKLFAKIYEIYNKKVFNPLKDERYFSTKTPKYYWISALMFSVGCLVTSAINSTQIYNRSPFSNQASFDTDNITVMLTFLTLGIWTLIDLKTTDTYLKKHHFLKKDEVEEIGSIRID